MLATVIRWFFVVLMAASAIGKLADMPGFFAIVATYDVLPAPLIPVAASLLALFELTLAGWLAIGRQLRRVAEALIALHAVYLVWLLVALVRGLAIANCGCFGVYWPRPLTRLTPLEDILLMALAVLLWKTSQGAGKRATSVIAPARR
jgi:hypothetical protein